MANYNNLSTLSGLKVGDVVTYNTQTTIDFKKYKVRITLNGIGYNSSRGGGLTQLDLDGTKLPAQTLTYTPLYGTSLCYGSSADMYYRIAVAGNCGYYSNSSCGKGGGTTGGKGDNGSNVSSVGGAAGGGGGGTQTSGGSGGSGISGGLPGTTHTSGITGSFGRNSKTYTASGIDRYNYFMAGWYSGGTGGDASYGSYPNYYSSTGGDGGGSGFVIGQSTTTYPSGYMGNNNTIINAIISGISNASLTQGTSTAYYTSHLNLPTTGYMTVEILELPPVTGPKYYNGSAWIDTTVKRYNGSAWEDVAMKYYNGSSWQ